ncbi:MAG TPA: hypothetical protein VFI80_04835 [Burkholderiales bacterium]|nr:hypothetical protein [Burkholderiales bacterium]
MSQAANGILCMLFGAVCLISLLALGHSIGVPGWPVNASTLFHLPLWAVGLIAVASFLVSAWFAIRLKRENE